MPELRAIKFDSGMQAVADRYKEKLEIETFQTSPGYTKFDTVETHRVIVTILNAKKLPENKKLEILANELAKEVYPQVINLL